MSTGFSFGTNTTAAPAFGSTSLTFGSAANQSQTTGLPFGSTPAAPGASTGLFSTPVSSSAGTAGFFGAAAPSAGLFGTATTSVAPHLSFGATTTSTAPNLSFGAPSSSAAPNLTFGAAASSAAPNLSFGAGNTLSFGTAQTTTTSTGSTFGAPPATSAPALTGGLSGRQPAPSFPTLGSGSGAPTTSVGAASFGFGFGTTTTGGLKLGAPAATTTTAGVSFGLGGLAPTSSTSASLTPATTASPQVGLGGIATSTQAKSSAITTQKEVPPKDQPLPNEILQTVESFKEMVKQQKSHSSDISRCSVRDFRRVEQEIDQLSNQLNEVENQLQKNRQIAEKLKYDTAKTVQNVEMAQRTHDTPPGLQYENTAPLKFFLNLADQFERDMQNLKIQIEAVDKYVKNHKNPDSLTPQDLAMGMRRLHETFVALAGRLQSVHSQVESQKETYLNIRKHILQDTSNPFDKLSKVPEFQVSGIQNAFVHSPPKVATGPTPFNNLASRTMSGVGPQQHTTPPPAYPGTSTSTGTGFGSSGFGAPAGGGQPSNTSLFGSTSFGQSSFGSSFQLQKPPTGNKRGKV